MSPRQAKLAVLGVGLLGAWLATAGTPQPPLPAAALSTPSAAPAAPDLVADMEKETERLRRGLSTLQGFQAPARNPFEFSGVSSSREPQHAVPLARPATEALPLAAEVPPPLALIGIAEDARAGAVVRTAILSGAGDVFLAGIGETVLGRYRVAAIAPEVVELTDDEGGRILRLVLR